jgi:KaiC/GvpD/RAD55 family RecA-like ATPase
MEKDKVKTYIEGFDELLNGGFPKGSNILISGTPGTGKTIFSMQYLYNGVVKDNEKGIYFTFEEKREALISQAKQFGWDIEKLEKEGKIKIIPIGTEDISKNTTDEIIEIIQNTKSKRIVIDSISTLAYLSPDSSENISANEYSTKKFLYSFLTKFSQLNDITTLIISQKDDKVSNSVSEYICDGVLSIEYESLGGDFSRSMTITKMRKTKNSEDLHPLEIRDKKGIVVHKL